MISCIKFFTKCDHPTDDNKKHFFHWELDQSVTAKKIDESEKQEPSPNPMHEKDSIINIRAKEKLLQRTSLQVRNNYSHWLISDKFFCLAI